MTPIDQDSDSDVTQALLPTAGWIPVIKGTFLRDAKTFRFESKGKAGQRQVVRGELSRLIAVKSE